MQTATSRILITGASGFVGRHLLPALRRALPAARIVAAGHGAAAAAPPAGADEAVRLDLLDPATAAAAVAAARPDAVLHLAAQAAVPASFADPLHTWRVNLLGSLALAQAVMEAAPGALFVHASSAEIYGLSFRSGGTLAEDAPLSPANPYAASKAAADLALGEMALRGLHALRLRPFNHTGPGQSEGFAVAAFARQLALIEAGLQPPVLRVGALDRWRDFLDVRDVCAAYVAALRRGRELPAGTCLNVASGQARRLGEVLQELVGRTGLSPRIETEPARLRPTDVERVVGDAGRARALLGWAPAVPWADTLDSVLEDWRRRVRDSGAAGPPRPAGGAD